MGVFGKRPTHVVSHGRDWGWACVDLPKEEPMRQGIRSQLTFANVVSVIALFVALGGTALASVIISSNSQVARNTISGHKPPSGKHPNIISGSINDKDIANGAVTAPKLGCKGNGPADVMVRAGAVCIDKYENSIWTAKT